MRVLVIGGGGREHALAWAMRRSENVELVVSAPGNPGCAALGPIHGASNAAEILALARELAVDLVVVGPEVPLVAGLADDLRAAGLAVFGPSAAAARLEGSKVFAKQFMARHGIPTAGFSVFDDAERACAFVRAAGRPMVVKADGLAAGKGVFVPGDLKETERAVRSLLVDRLFGAAGERILVEERLEGPELSITAVVDGERWLSLPPSRDHKRLLDGDRGPNTGGMGAIAPVPGISGGLLEEIDQGILAPVIAGMAEAGTPFTGCLYVGLMLTAAGPKVLEFNVRFGDPETQVLMPLLEGDVAGLLASAARGRLEADRVRLASGSAATIVLAAPGYPSAPQKGSPIRGAEELPAGVELFHAGTRRNAAGQLLTAGGRVLCLTGLGESLDEALNTTYAAVQGVHFVGAHYRRDIGCVATS